MRGRGANSRGGQKNKNRREGCDYNSHITLIGSVAFGLRDERPWFATVIVEAEQD